MNYFHEALSMTVPDNVGVVTSPMEIDTVSFDKDSATDDSVEKATKNFWDNAGVSQILFSSDNKTSQGIAMSIATDEQFAQLQIFIKVSILIPTLPVTT